MRNETLAKLLLLRQHDKYTVAEVLGELRLQDVVDALQDLLMKEYLQRDVYESFRYMLFSPAGIPIRSHLEEHMMEEMNHIDVLQRYIVGYSKLPTLERYPVKDLGEYSLKAIMEYNLELEQDAVNSYSLLISALGKQGPEYIALISELENIVVQEAEHVHDLQRWLKE